MIVSLVGSEEEDEKREKKEERDKEGYICDSD